MDQFYVKLDALDDLGQNRLPAIHDSITSAIEKLNDAMLRIFEVFDMQYPTRPDDSEAVGRWPSSRHLFWQPGKECYIAIDYMRRVFKDNAENVDLAAQAIREIAHRYRQVDGRG